MTAIIVALIALGASAATLLVLLLIEGIEELFGGSRHEPVHG